MDMTEERWGFTNRYAQEVFGAQDEVLDSLVSEAASEGLPNWAVSPDVGRLLMILTSMTRGRLALEIGTLGGYSGIWITRGLKPDGRLITIEYEPKHAAFARRQFTRAGLADRVEVREGAALEVLEELGAELEEGSVDVVFIDAEKTEYPDYFRLTRSMVAPGGLLLADNVYGTSGGWIDQTDRPGVNATDAFNRMVAGDPDFEAVAVPIRQGVLIARRRSG